MNRIIHFFLHNKLVTTLLVTLIIIWGLVTMPFGNKPSFLPNDPVAVDAIPDIGENQQIVYTEWKGQSPQDIEDQITYPLTSSLLGLPGVKSIRSNSMFGLSSIYVIFEEDIAFYWSRSRILEKLNSLPENLLPENIKPALGPDATGLGQVFWYTLEGQDSLGRPTGGWDLHELRTTQDFYVKYSLSSIKGVAEVASIGGFVKEFQIDVVPEKMEHYNITLQEIVSAVKNSNQEQGNKTLEINKAEYFVRSLGYVKNLSDIESAVIKTLNNTPIRIRDVAKVKWGPQDRRGILDKNGIEAVGGVVTARYGENPMQVIEATKTKIKEIQSGLPQKQLTNGVTSKLTIVPFYDRSQLIQETLGTLSEALSLEILITILVILVMVVNLRASIIISTLLPISVLLVFIIMRYTGITANIVALSGIAIAIGTMVDLAIILVENVIRHIKENEKEKQPLITVVFNASKEVSSAILTAVLTTIVSFIPVFALEGAEGKLFAPLAYTKSFALLAALFVTLIILPALTHSIFKIKFKKQVELIVNVLLIIIGIISIFSGYWIAWVFIVFGGIGIYENGKSLEYYKLIKILVAALATCQLLALYWLPLGPEQSLFSNFLFVFLLVGGILGSFQLFIYFYEKVLRFFLQNKMLFLIIPFVMIVTSLHIWLGFDGIWSNVVNGKSEIKKSAVWKKLDATFPGVEKEFLPALDEGDFLLMPTSLPHAGTEENRKIVSQLDKAVMLIPEIKMAVGKAGRANTSLDPAPLSMYENIILYFPEYQLDEYGKRARFKIDRNNQYVFPSGKSFPADHIRNNKWQDSLQVDAEGNFFRNWRKNILSKDDIWNEIVTYTKLPGITSAPKLQPIETRLIMLQTGMRAPMGIKVFGQNLDTIGAFGLALEKILENVEGVKKGSVFAERTVGKPYLEIDIDRKKIGQYGISLAAVQETINIAIGGQNAGTTVAGRERYNLRVRYPLDYRSDPQQIEDIKIPLNDKKYIRLNQVAEVKYRQGPQSIKSENTFLVSYVLFDKEDGFAEMEVIENAQQAIDLALSEKKLKLSPGVTYEFSGNYENQVRAEKRLMLIIPIVLIVIFLILYFQFKSSAIAMMVFSSIAVAFAGGFIMLWFYSGNGFLNFTLFGTSMRDLFQIHTINLSIAVWVGFIALFGIATDDGVVMSTYLVQSFKNNPTQNKQEIREAVIEAGKKRVRPCLMTTATTLIALLPILTSTGKGSDIMIPMAIPAFGGMAFALLTLFVIPVLFSGYKELKLKKK